MIASSNDVSVSPSLVDLKFNMFYIDTQKTSDQIRASTIIERSDLARATY